MDANNPQKETPLVSVIMGVYNGAQFLREAVESVLCQTYDHFEFVICNDCSRDESEEILKEFARKDSRIILLKNEKNMGLAATLNRCLEVAKGELIARMDCDDRSLPNRFADQVEWLCKHPQAVAVGMAVEFIDDSGAVFARQNKEQDEFYTLKDVVRATPLVHPSTMIRRDALNAVGGYTVNALTTRAEDYDLWCKLCEQDSVVANMAVYGLQYREDQSNIVRRKYKYRIQEAKLKFYWMKRAQCMGKDYIYALKPLVVGLLPMSLYKQLHRKKISGK